MSDTHQIPSEERPFALCFHGFIEEGPHVVQRFTTFCTSDLHLTTEETGHILAQPGSAVICRKESPDDLSALADAFEQLGVRVSIADLCEQPSHSDVAPARDREELSPPLEQLRRAPSLRVMQSSLASDNYLGSPKEDTQTQTRTLPSHLGMRHRRSRSIRPRTYRRRETGLSGIQMIGMLVVGLACLIGINRAFIGKPDLSGTSSRYKLATSWGIPAPQEKTTAAPPARHKHYDGTVWRNAYSLSISSRMHDGALSARVLMVTPLNTQGSPEQAPSSPQLRRAESDTTLLRESEPGVWTGQLVTYLFIEHGDDMLRVPAQTGVTLQIAEDGHSAHAAVEIAATIANTLVNLTDVKGIARTVTDDGLSLKLYDRVLLRSTSVSF